LSRNNNFVKSHFICHPRVGGDP